MQSIGRVTRPIRFEQMSNTFAEPEIGEFIDLDEDVLMGRAKMYKVILLDDNDHTYEYVIEMLQSIFGFGEAKCFAHAVEVDTKGHTVLIILPLGEAEKKRDAIHAYGPDWRMERSLGSMAALLEPAASDD